MYRLGLAAQYLGTARAWVLATLVVSTTCLCGVSAGAAALADSGWRHRAMLPVPAVGLAATRLPDGTILAAGGEPALGTPTRMAAVLLPGSNAWRRLPNAPIELDTPAVLPLTTRAVMIVAPAFANGTIAAPSEAVLLDPRSGSWIVLPRVPVALFAPRLIRVNMRTIAAVGGAGQDIGATFDFQLQRWTVMHGPINNLASYSVAMLPRLGLLLLGSVGIDAGKRPYAIRRAWLRQLDGVWHELARPPVEVDGAQAILLDAGHVMFGGGYPIGDDPRASAPPSLIYDSRADTWAMTHSVGDAHRGAELVALGNGRAVLLGGHSAGGSPSSTCEIYDGSGWHRTEPLPQPWAGYGVVALDGNTILIVGGDRAIHGTVSPVADTMLLAVGPAAVG